MQDRGQGVADANCENKKVPDRVVVFQLSPGEKCYSARMTKPARDQRHKATSGHRSDEGRRSHYREPAHHKIDGGGYPVPADLSHHRFDNHPVKSHGPEHRKQTPPLRSAQREISAAPCNPSKCQRLQLMNRWSKRFFGLHYRPIRATF